MMQNNSVLDQNDYDGDQEDYSDADVTATIYYPKRKFQGRNDEMIHLRKLIRSKIMAEPCDGVRGRNFPMNHDHALVNLPMPLEVNEVVNGTPVTTMEYKHQKNTSPYIRTLCQIQRVGFIAITNDETSTLTTSIGPLPTSKFRSHVMQICSHHLRSERQHRSTYSGGAHTEGECKVLICGFCLQAFTGHYSGSRIIRRRLIVMKTMRTTMKSTSSSIRAMDVAEEGVG